MQKNFAYLFAEKWLARQSFVFANIIFSDFGMIVWIFSSTQIIVGDKSNTEK